MLIRFHRVLILSAMALTALFALRALALFVRSGRREDLILALVATGLEIGLVAYFRKIRAR